MLRMSNVLTFIIPPELQQKIDTYWQKHKCRSRSEALREIVNFYFEQEKTA
jgi:metal-responsive CopG/Arc/MetJ family transcriptional regulator